jgi:hypothetical protein
VYTICHGSSFARLLGDSTLQGDDYRAAANHDWI